MLMVSRLALAVEMTLPFLTHEILLVGGYPPLAVHMRVAFSLPRRAGLLAWRETTAGSVEQKKQNVFYCLHANKQFKAC